MISFDNTRKITKCYLTKTEVKALREKYSGIENISIKTRPAGKGILERVNADIFITGTLAEQLATVRKMEAL